MKKGEQEEARDFERKAQEMTRIFEKDICTKLGCAARSALNARCTKRSLSETSGLTSKHRGDMYYAYAEKPWASGGKVPPTTHRRSAKRGRPRT